MKNKNVSLAKPKIVDCMRINHRPNLFIYLFVCFSFHPDLNARSFVFINILSFCTQQLFLLTKMYLLAFFFFFFFEIGRILRCMLDELESLTLNVDKCKRVCNSFSLPFFAIIIHIKYSMKKSTKKKRRTKTYIYK